MNHDIFKFKEGHMIADNMAKVDFLSLPNLINQLGYTVYTQTAGDQFSCIVYTQNSLTALPHGKIEAASPPRLHQRSC